MAIVLSAKRCGSTIVQNITHIILNKTKGRIKKHHSFLKTDEPVIITIRDPRDMVISIRRNLLLDYYVDKVDKDKPIKDLKFLNNSIITKQLSIQNKLCDYYKNRKNALILKYDDCYSDGLGVYDKIGNKIANFLNKKYTNEIKELVDDILDFDNLVKISNSMKTFKNNDTEHGLKTQYGLHGGHIKSKVISGWVNVVPKYLHDDFNEKLKNYIEKYNDI